MKNSRGGEDGEEGGNVDTVALPTAAQWVN
jgi:hypothetical protein